MTRARPVMAILIALLPLVLGACSSSSSTSTSQSGTSATFVAGASTTRIDYRTARGMAALMLTDENSYLRSKHQSVSVKSVSCRNATTAQDYVCTSRYSDHTSYTDLDRMRSNGSWYQVRSVKNEAQGSSTSNGSTATTSGTVEAGFRWSSAQIRSYVPFCEEGSGAGAEECLAQVCVLQREHVKAGYATRYWEDVLPTAAAMTQAVAQASRATSAPSCSGIQDGNVVSGIAASSG